MARLEFIEGVDKSVLKFTKEDVLEQENEWNATVFGVVVGERVSYSAFGKFVSNNWDVDTPTILLKENGVWVIQFKNVEDKQKILSNEIWMLPGYKPLVLQEWCPGVKMEWSSFTTLPVWVFVSNVWCLGTGILVPCKASCKEEGATD